MVVGSYVSQKRPFHTISASNRVETDPVPPRFSLGCFQPGSRRCNVHTVDDTNRPLREPCNFQSGYGRVHSHYELSTRIECGACALWWFSLSQNALQRVQLPDVNKFPKIAGPASLDDSFFLALMMYMSGDHTSYSFSGDRGSRLSGFC